MTGKIVHVFKKLIRDQVYFDQSALAVLQHKQGVGVAENVDAVADAGSSQQQGLANMAIRAVHFARMDAEGKRGQSVP